MDTDLHRNILKFGHRNSYNYKAQLSHSIDRSDTVAKFQLPKLKDISIKFWKMIVCYINCEYLSPHNNMKYAHL